MRDFQHTVMRHKDMFCFQREGAPQSRPLSLVLANVVAADQEQKIVEQFMDQQFNTIHREAFLTDGKPPKFDSNGALFSRLVWYARGG